MAELKHHKKEIIALIAGTIIVVSLVIYFGLTLYVKSEALKKLYNTADSKDKNPTFEFEQIYVENEKKEKLDFMFIENTSSDKVILYFHGNAGRTLQLMEDLSKHANVLSPSYPGYSKSEGKPSEENIYETVDLAVKYLTETKSYKIENIIFYGHSMGGSPAVYANTQYGDKVAGTILVNTFDNIKSMCWMDYNLLCIALETTHNSTTMAKDMKGKVRQFHVVTDTNVVFERGKVLSSKIKVSDYKFTELTGTHSVFDTSKTVEDFFDISE